MVLLWYLAEQDTSSTREDKMDILIIGGGGREHAIALSLKKSPKAGKLYCLPGNGGISEIAKCVDISVMDFDKIIDFLKANRNIELTIVAPDDPLAEGLVDRLEAEGFSAFGPSKNASQIEASKVFSKNLMKKYNIPTAEYEAFSDYAKALEYIEKSEFPLVIKADGLALGKGVIICNTLSEGKEALKSIMQDYKFGKAGNNVIIEEFMQGKEVSVLAFCDGTTIKPMVSSQDHKRAYDNDMGLNTGGMGTFSPSKAYTKEIEDFTYNNIILPSMHALNQEGCKFKGILYFGLMLTEKGVKVLEYNARFGDPETQVVLPLLETDLLDIINAIIDERLVDIEIKWSSKSAVCVILASGGYPLDYQKGLPITIEDLDKEITLFHAGTIMKNGRLLTSGGRVIGVSAVGNSIEECRKKVYSNINKVSFEGVHYRTDIGIKL